MIQINDSNYIEQIYSEGIVLIDFWGTWCSPCERLSHLLEHLEKEYNTIKFCKANIEENFQLRKQFRIMSLPTLVLLKDGEIVERISGFREEDELKNILNKYM